jgi:hypothetical protein
MKPTCKSIKSKKHPELRCPNPAVKGDWCAMHHNSKKLWTPLIITVSQPLTQEKAAQKIQSFWCKKGRRNLCKSLGPAFLFPELSENRMDIYSYEPVNTIPLTYRFSFSDQKKHIWLFDIRFLLQLLNYGKELNNPFTQDPISHSVLQKFQNRINFLREKKIPVVYTETDSLTPEQIWNQKVLDIFLKLNSLGYSANVLWFESLTIKGHFLFYRYLWLMWNQKLNLSEEDKERIVPGHSSGRHPLFRWDPSEIRYSTFDLRLWRKMNLNIMKAFLTRTESTETQGCGALYILTALANVHPLARLAFPWLVEN